MNFDGSHIKDSSDISIAPIKLWPHALFNSLDAFICGTQVTMTYPVPNCYKSYFELVLGKSESAREHLHGSDGWADYNDRREQFSNSSLVEFHSSLCQLDFFRSQRLFPNLPMDLRFNRSSSNFILEGSKELAGKFRLVIEDIYLNIRYVHLAQSIVESHKRLHQTHPFVFPYLENRLKHLTIPVGSISLNFAHTFLNKLPRVVYCALVNTNSLSGAADTFDKSPFDFAQNGLSYISCKRDGMIQCSSHQYNFTKDGGGLLKAFKMLQTCVGLDDNFSSNDLSFQKFRENTFILPFNFIASLNNFASISSGSNGELSFEVMFHSATTEPLSLILYSSYNNLLAIDKELRVSSIVF